MRVNITVPDDLVKQIDDQAKSLGISRAAYIVMSMAQKVQADKVMDSMPDLKHAILEIEKTLKLSKGE